MTVSASPAGTGAVAQWSSRLGFLLAAMGGAVGLGNIWRFPYVAGESGGGAFILIYVLCIIVVGIPLIMAELAIGRRGGHNAVKTMRKITSEQGSSSFWNCFGWFAVVVPLLGLSYYSVVAGWSIDYLINAVQGAFDNLDAQSSGAAFASMTSSPYRVAITHVFFIAITVVIVARGVNAGLEKSVRFLMPALGILVLFLVGYAAFAGDWTRAATFLFQPDFSKLTGTTVLMALGQAFFSLAVAAGLLVTYGAYLPKSVSIPRSAVVIGAGDTAIALLMGLAIFPLVFSFGLMPGEGPGLVFVTLPVAFGQMPAGLVLGSVFFLLMFVAAITTSIGMLEPSVLWAIERFNLSRKSAALWMGLTAWLIGLGAVFSFNLLADFSPLGFIALFEGKNIFDILDFAVANLLLPLSGLVLALFAGWVFRQESLREELGLTNETLLSILQLALRYIAPVAIAAVLVYSVATHT